MKTALSIAGSDCSGGAGIQADIKTMITNGVYAMSAITALTAQKQPALRQLWNPHPNFWVNSLKVSLRIFIPMP